MRWKMQVTPLGEAGHRVFLVAANRAPRRLRIGRAVRSLSPVDVLAAFAALQPPAFVPTANCIGLSSPPCSVGLVAMRRPSAAHAEPVAQRADSLGDGSHASLPDRCAGATL